MRRRAVPAGLLGMLALVAGVERYVAAPDDDLCHPWGRDWRAADRAARGKAAGCDVLCFGDSLAKYAVIP